MSHDEEIKKLEKQLEKCSQRQQRAAITDEPAVQQFWQDVMEIVKLRRKKIEATIGQPNIDHLVMSGQLKEIGFFEEIPEKLAVGVQAEIEKINNEIEALKEKQNREYEP